MPLEFWLCVAVLIGALVAWLVFMWRDTEKRTDHIVDMINELPDETRRRIVAGLEAMLEDDGGDAA